jgi:hypothetical protein
MALNKRELMMHSGFGIKAVLFMLFVWCTYLQANAQATAGIKFGASTPDVSPSEITIIDKGVNYYHITVAKEGYGFHAGIFLEAQMGHFFVQPELLFNSSNVEYNLDSLATAGTQHAQIDETYRHLDIPLTMGFKAGVLRIGVGPVGHIYVSSENGFEGYEGYAPDFDKFSWGWQGGIGLDFWKLHFDVRYESNNAQLGDHLTFFGKDFDFATDNNRFLASVGLSF